MKEREDQTTAEASGASVAGKAATSIPTLETAFVSEQKQKKTKNTKKRFLHNQLMRIYLLLCCCCCYYYFYLSLSFFFPPNWQYWSIPTNFRDSQKKNQYTHTKKKRYCSLQSVNSVFLHLKCNGCLLLEVAVSCSNSKVS